MKELERGPVCYVDGKLQDSKLFPELNEENDDFLDKLILIDAVKNAAEAELMRRELNIDLSKN